MNDRQVLDEQMAYYRARAGEYDEWFFREGRYDRGPEHRAQWFQEVSAVEAELNAAAPRGDVLELACGTGLWTRHLLATAEKVTAVDAAPETIAVNRERVRSDRVEYVVADIFSWAPPRLFDFALFTFWLSHVPSSRFDAFWAMLARALRPGGRVFFVDSLLTQESTARDHEPIDDSGIVRRKLNDGREFDIVKIFHEPTGLEPRLAALGWRGYVRSSGQFFVYGCVTHEGAAR
jgi:demethylmenaquinone methyltransferase/2-methoxy-6-polyprenyl-1,4-benzoquinol methylase